MEILWNILGGLKTLLKAAELLPDFSSPRGIFCSIAWLATLLTMLMGAISFFFDAGDADADVDGGDVDGDTGVFSVRAVLGFLLGFGWGGYVAIQFGGSVPMAILVGLVVGVLMFLIVAGMMRLIYSLKSDGSLNYESLVGRTGTVYVTIPPRGEPGGQVQVSHPSQLITMAAVQEGDTPLPPQSRVEVVAATTYQLTVRPVGVSSPS